MDQVKFFKGCPPQISLGPFLNTLSHLMRTFFVFKVFVAHFMYFLHEIRIEKLSPSIQQWTKWNLWKTALKIFIWFTLDYCVANIDKTFFGRPYRLNGTKIRLDASLMTIWRGTLYVVMVQLMSNCLWSRWKLQRGVCLVSLLSYCPVIQKTQILKKSQKKKART